MSMFDRKFLEQTFHNKLVGLDREQLAALRASISRKPECDYRDWQLARIDEKVPYESV